LPICSDCLNIPIRTIPQDRKSEQQCRAHIAAYLYSVQLHACVCFPSFRRYIVEISALLGICTALVGFLPATHEEGSVKISRNVGDKLTYPAQQPRRVFILYVSHICANIFYLRLRMFLPFSLLFRKMVG